LNDNGLFENPRGKVEEALPLRRQKICGKLV